MQALTVTTFSDEQNGEGATTKRIALGASKVYPSKNFPLAVLDSGGVQILVSSRSYADSIYSAFGITASSDGLCKFILAIGAWVRTEIELTANQIACVVLSSLL